MSDVVWWVLFGVAVWALIVVGIIAVVHGAGTERRRIEGGRPEDWQ